MTKQNMTAQELLDWLLQLSQEHGKLDIPISIFINEDRVPVEAIDVFYDNNDKDIHSIDLNAGQYQ